MDLRKFINSLEKYEKTFLLELLIEDRENQQAYEKELFEANKLILIEWSKNQISNRLCETIAKHYTTEDCLLDFDVINNIGDYEFKNIRGLGAKSILEFKNLKPCKEN